MRVRLAGLLATALLTGCEPDVADIAALGTLERDRIKLVADSTERIISVLVEEGQHVDVDDVLVRQDTARAEVALARARADQAVANAALIEAEAGPRQQQISQARARLQASESAVNTARIELERARSLLTRQLTSKNNVDLLQGRFDEATAREVEARAGLDELMEGTRSEAIDQARSRHAAAIATVRDLEITLARAATVAPVAGTVESLPYNEGERPPFGTTIAVLLASGRTYARVHVSAPLRAHLTSGSEALVWIDGRGDPLRATLRWIAADAAFTPYFALNQYDRSRLSFLAEVDLLGNDESLPIGIPVEVTFPGIGQ